MHRKHADDNRIQERHEPSGVKAPDEHQVFVSEIPDFFQDCLDEPQLHEFLKHYDSCADCREEVAIQFLIHEGLARVESGTAFHFEREMGECIEERRERLIRRERFTRFTFVFEFLTLALFTASAVVFIMFYIL